MKTEKTNINGRETTVKRWPVENRRAKLIVVHGLGEHVGRYDVISKEFNEAGIEMVGFDQRGHGENSGRKGHVRSFKDFLDDLNSFVKGEKCDVPLFMLGHSLGGLIAARFVEEYPEAVKGVVLSSGAFTSKNVSGALKFVAKLFSILLPTLTFNNNINPKNLSRNDDVVKEYTSDPLVHSKVSARLAAEMFKNIDILFEKSNGFTLPVLLLAGGQDKVVPPEGTKKLFSKISSQDKKMKIFEGAYHEIFCDPELSHEFRKVIVDWIVERI